ncbi:MAG: hypothetical protein VB096_00010 [Pseudoflavonifractor sp.]|nr:hypothetical protein [Pseudoflavonifractor sp.]
MEIISHQMFLLSSQAQLHAAFWLLYHNPQVPTRAAAPPRQEKKPTVCKWQTAGFSTKKRFSGFSCQF